MRLKLILMLMIAGLVAYAQSPQDYVVMRAWDQVRRGAVADTIPRDGLILEYLFATGATTNDTSGSGNNNLIFLNSASAAGGILDLTGSSTAYAHTAANIPSGMTNIAYSFWLKGSDANANWPGSVDTLGTSVPRSSNMQYRPDLSPPQFTMIQYNDSGDSFDVKRATNNLPTATDWHHVVVQWSAGSTMTIHINGNATTGAQSSAGTRPATVLAYRLRLGSNAGTGVTTRYYRGYQARWRVYNRPGLSGQILSNEEIQALYNEGAPE